MSRADPVRVQPAASAAPEPASARPDIDDVRVAEDQHVIKLTGVSKSFGPRCVLQDISLTVRKGEFVALLGASGSGASSALWTGPQAGNLRSRRTGPSCSRSRGFSRSARSAGT